MFYYYEGIPSKAQFFDTHPSHSLNHFIKAKKDKINYLKLLKSISFKVRHKPVGRVYDNTAGQCNKEIFERKGDRLKYQSEQLVPTKTDKSPPLLLVLGNPASHSVAAGMFFAFKDNGKENRFWKSILKPAGVLSFSFDENLPTEELNALRKEQLLELDYESPFRIGLCVFISMPSAPGGPYGGVAGVRKLLGVRVLRRLEAEESKRVTKCAKTFIGDDSRGKIVTFQKNAWNCLKSDDDVSYSLEQAKKGGLIGSLQGMPNIPLLGAPPTRLSGRCFRVLRQLLNEQGNN